MSGEQDRDEPQRERQERESDREVQKQKQAEFESATGFSRRVFVGRRHIRADSGVKPVQIGVRDPSSKSLSAPLITCLVLVGIVVLLSVAFGA